MYRRFPRPAAAWGLFLFVWATGQAQSVRINEVQPLNRTVYADERGEFPDWIELYNPGQQAVDLAGWGLSDDPEEPASWILPRVRIAPGQFLLVLASGETSGDWPAHWETTIDQGSNWKYFVGSAEPPAAWKDTSFNDGGWKSGPSGFGYGDNDDATVVPSTRSVYIRKSFTIASRSEVEQALLHVDFDDGFVAYLNGIEIARSGLGEYGSAVVHNRLADYSREALIHQGGSPELFNWWNYADQLVEGTNVLALQVHNVNDGSSDLSLIPFLTLGFSVAPPGARGVPAVLARAMPHLRAGFRLDADGETLVLTDAAGRVVDRVETGPVPADLSAGRPGGAVDTWAIFSQPTPGRANPAEGFSGASPEPLFSHPPGLQPAPFTLRLTTESGASGIRYTVDGSEPREDSALYQTGIPVTGTRVVRARSFEPGKLPSRTVTATYLLAVQTRLPIVSLSTAPANFFDPQDGIYVESNLDREIEKPVHVEFFESDGRFAIGLDAGVRLFGGWTRRLPQKSLALFARKEYGTPEIEYQVFSDRPFDRFDSLVLRNSGNDWYGGDIASSNDLTWQPVMFRDGLMTGLVDGLNFDTPAFRPAILFLNGEYWGIHNIREKVNESFLTAHHGVERDDIDLLEGWGWPLAGENQDYVELIEYVTANDLRVPAAYNQVASRIDADSLIDYFACQIYFANTDWPGNNIKFWRADDLPNARWRWILFDTDFGFGLAERFDHNTLDFALDASGPDWPNPPWSTLLFRKLMENSDFRTRFVNRFCLLAATRFEESRVVDRIAATAAAIEPEMPAHIARWGGSMAHWVRSVSLVTLFGRNRLPVLLEHFTRRLQLGKMSALTLTVEPPESGSLTLDGSPIPTTPWTGRFFEGLPLGLHALPRAGYEFSGWIEEPTATSLIRISLQGDRTLTARFERRTPATGIVINEINYNSNRDFDPGDWIELFNGGKDGIDLGGWRIQASPDAVPAMIPALTLPPGGFLVLCRDGEAFREHFPSSEPLVDGLDFGLSRTGDSIRLLDRFENLIDEVRYNDRSPWPLEADGEGSTLELISPLLDNSLPGNWLASVGHGSPAAPNGVLLKPCAVPGDTDGDGRVGVPDVVLLLRQLLGSFPDPAGTSCLNDIDNDGSLGVADLILTLGRVADFE